MAVRAHFMRMNGDSNDAERATDAWLVVAAQGGDRRAIALLARRWHRRLMAHGWRLTGDRAMAEEAVQAAWADIVRGIARLRDERAFPAWAYRIVTRKTAGAIGERVSRRALATALETDALHRRPAPKMRPTGRRCATPSPPSRPAIARRWRYIISRG